MLVSNLKSRNKILIVLHKTLVNVRYTDILSRQAKRCLVTITSQIRSGFGGKQKLSLI